MMAARADNLYSRFVSWAKLILPVAGLVILSSLFLFSKSYVPDSSAVLFEGDFSEFSDRERITGPKFYGMTPSGVAIRLSAREASPRKDSPRAFDAADLNANVELPDGNSVNVIAETGSIDSETMLAQLTGGIILDTSWGYIARTSGMTFGLDRLNIRSHGEITATGPLGNITAGEMTLGLEGPETENVEAGYVLVFKSGVKLVYKP